MVHTVLGWATIQSIGNGFVLNRVFFYSNLLGSVLVFGLCGRMCADRNPVQYK